MNPHRKLLGAIIGAAIALVATLILMVVLANGPITVKPIESLDYSQSQPLPGRVKTTYTTSQQSHITAFTTLLMKHNVNPSAYKDGNFDPKLDDRCTGGLTTTILIHYTDLSKQKLVVYSCGGLEDQGTFIADATALFTSWRAQQEGK